MLNFALIGAGRLGKVHADNINKLPETQLTAVYDAVPGAAAELAGKYQAACCASADEAVNHPGVDAVVIASPTFCHFSDAMLALDAGKALFCEKPLTLKLADALTLQQKVHNSGAIMSVGFVRRHLKKWQIVHQLIKSGQLGKIKFCNIYLPFGAYKRLYGDWFTDFEKSGGVITDMLAHHLDLANWLFGTPQRVYAQSLLLDPAQELPGDYVSANITFANRIIMNVMASWQRFGRSGELMEIYGEKGCIAMDYDPAVKLTMTGSDTEIIPAVDPEPIPGTNGAGFINEIRNFAATINGQFFDFMPTVDDGVNSLKTADAMIRSSRTGKVIEF
ncbi:MAG: Gfo/Idh/MocA family oxidoreductase [Lentisphaerae bacterium]|nr:Gfo/Idh/MocA family oxidoreductase [Lentisphaerota bacterium]